MLALVDERMTPKTEAPRDFFETALRRITEILLFPVYKLSTAELYQKAARIAPGSVTARQPRLTLSRRRVSFGIMNSGSTGIFGPVAAFLGREVAAMGFFIFALSIMGIVNGAAMVRNYEVEGIL
jgi:hypothetical protein